MAVTVKVEGLRELEQAMKDLTKAAGRGVLRRSLKKAAEPMAAIAKAKAPDDLSTGGFDLKRSIKVGDRLSRSEKKAHRRMFRNNRAAVEMFVGAGPLPQAVFMEFGTAPFINRGQFAGTRNPGVKPQPFMRPAWDSDHKALLERLSGIMRVEIDKAILRAQRKAERLRVRG